MTFKPRFQFVTGEHFALERNGRLSRGEYNEHFALGFRRGYSMALSHADKLQRTGYLRTTDIINTLENYLLTVVARWSNRQGEEEPPPIRQEPWWDLRQQVLEAYGARCEECGSTDQIEIDHIRPVSKGGLSEIANLRPLCRTCNRAKAAK